jgi:hypothetical protein
MGTTDEGGLILADAMNTYDPALTILQERGYRVWVRPVGEVDEGEEWLARKDGNELIAGDPLRLLGLAAILETRGVNWQTAGNKPRLYDAIRAEAYDT